MRRQVLAGAGVTALALFASGATGEVAQAEPTAARPVTIAFSDGRSVPSVSTLQTEMGYYSKLDCAGQPVRGTRTVKQAIGDAIKLEGRAGSAAVKAVNSGRDKRPALAEADAGGALARNNPVGAVAALIAAYRVAPKTATVLRDLGAVLAQLGRPTDALALFAQADKVGGNVARPMGISETATELNDRGFALLEMRQWKQAGTLLAKAVKAAPLLAEAKLNLGVALMCQHKNAQGAKMIFAGARRTPLAKYDDQGNETVPPAGKVIDVSQGHAGSWPAFGFPQDMQGVITDGDTFKVFYQHYFNAAQADTDKGGALLGPGLTGMPAISIARINNLEKMVGDGVAGGWASLRTKALAAQTKANDFLNATFGSDGTATVELETLKAGPCGQDKAAMMSFLTSQTAAFHHDMVAWVTAQRALWAAQSRWGTAIYANIANPDINKAEALELDFTKEAYLYDIMSELWSWDDEAGLALEQVESEVPPLVCPDTFGPDQSPPGTTLDHIVKCPEDLARASYSLSLGIFSISVTCEKVTLGASEPGLGPFARLTVTSAGDVTVMAGVKAGVSLGPVSAGVEAGAYLTMHGNTVTDVGITASASAGASEGPISLSGPSAGATFTMADISQAVDSLIQPSGG